LLYYLSPDQLGLYRGLGGRRRQDFIFKRERWVQMTEAELIQISRDFKKMIEAIPKTRVREHIPTINQISGLLGRQKSEIYQAARALDAWREGRQKLIPRQR
jgi:hypothetical protein